MHCAVSYITHTYVYQYHVFQITAELAQILDVRVLVARAVLPVQTLADDVLLVQIIYDVVCVLDK